MKVVFPSMAQSPPKIAKAPPTAGHTEARQYVYACIPGRKIEQDLDLAASNP